MAEQEIVTPQVDAMEDLAWNPLRLQEFELQRRAGTFTGPIPSSPAPLHPPRLHLSPPQLSTAQRRANQADQPRETNGKYAERPPDKWDQIRAAGANAKSSSSSSSRASEKPGLTRKHIARGPQVRRGPTALKRAKKPAAARRTPITRSASVEEAMDFSPMGKVKWLVGRKTAPARRRWKWRLKRLKVGARHVKEFFGRFRRAKSKKKLPRLFQSSSSRDRG